MPNDTGDLIGLVRPTVPGRPNESAALVAYRPWPRLTSLLRGYADVDFNGWQVLRIPIFKDGDGRLSVGSPSAPELDGEGRPRIGDNGKRVYAPLMRFRDNDARRRFERAVVSALADAGVSP